MAKKKQYFKPGPAERARIKAAKKAAKEAGALKAMEDDEMKQFIEAVYKEYDTEYEKDLAMFSGDEGINMEENGKLDEQAAAAME